MRETLPLCIPVNLSLRTVNSYIFPKFSKRGFSSFSSKFRGIWPMKSLMASWSLVGAWLSQLFCPTLSCRETGSTNPFTSVAMLIPQTTRFPESCHRSLHALHKPQWPVRQTQDELWLVKLVRSHAFSLFYILFFPLNFITIFKCRRSRNYELKVKILYWEWLIKWR